MINKSIAIDYLKNLYSNNTNKEVCKILQITEPTLLTYVKTYNIQKKGSGRRKKIKMVK